MAGSETGSSRGLLTAGHTIHSADFADSAIGATRTRATSLSRDLRVTSQFTATLLALAVLAAGAPTAAQAQAAADFPEFERAAASPAPREIPDIAERRRHLRAHPPATGEVDLGATFTGSVYDSLRAGASIRAYTDSIKDADGLDNVEFEFQWVRVLSGGAEIDIPEAVRLWYYVGEDDVGQRLKVRVSFLDDEGHGERIESRTTAVIEAMTTVAHATVSLEADRDTVEVGEYITFTMRRRGEMQREIRGDINVQGIEPDISEWVLYAFVFRNGDATRTWRLRPEPEPNGVHTAGRTITALLRGVFDDHTVADTSAVSVVVVPAGSRPTDVTPPDVDNATVDGATLVITYDESLGPGSEPGTGDYSVRINSGTGTRPTGVDVSGTTVTLTLGTPVAYGDNVTVSYTAPTTGGIEDNYDNKAGDLTNHPVTNNTPAPAPVIDAPATLSLAEGVGTYAFRVTLSRAINENVTVNVSAQAGTATAGQSGDYEAAAGTLTISAGQTSSGTHTLTISDDDIDEGNETFSLVLSSASSNATIGNDETVVTIVDDDIRGLLASPGTVEVPEGDMATYTLVLESKPTETVTVTATRTGDSDITVTGGSSLTFTADDWYLPQTVTLSAADDADDQDGTATITHATSGGDYGANSVSASVTAVEQDKMDAAAKVTLSVGPDDVGESDGQTTVTVTGRLDGEALASPTTVTVRVGASGDGATAGTDYATSGGFTFEIAAQATSGSGTFTITPTDDDVDEGNESVTVSGSVSGLTVSPATLTIVDDDTRGLLASPGTVEVPEGDTETYTLVLESKPTETVTVTATRTGDSDITVTGGSSLTFTADDWYLPQTVTLSAADDADDQDGTATITHATSGGDYGANSVSASVTAVEQDKMDAAAKVTLSVGPDDVGESDGQTTVTVTGRLDGEALGSPTTVTVRVGASGDGATAGTDYATSGGFTFEIAAQATSGSGTFTITPTDDDVDEGNESVTVSGSVSGLTVSPATLTIVDDDTRGLFASPGTVEVPEGDTETYTLVLESKPTETVTVTATRTGDSDITVTGGASLTFTADDWYLPQTVTLSAADDADDQDGTATITHATSGGDYGANSVSASVTAVEQDKMDAAAKVTLSVGPDDVGESDGQTTVTVTGRLDGEALGSPTTVTVRVGASGDGATAGTDYATSGGFTFEIAAQATSGSGTFTITPTDDDVDEGNESVTVSGSVTGLTVAPATLAIVDDDTRGLFPSPGTVEVPEDGTAMYTLVLESKPTASVTVTATRTGDSDIAVTDGASLTFTTDNWFQPQTVELSAAVDADSANGTATISHATSGGDYGANSVSASVTANEVDNSDEGDGNNGGEGETVSTGVTLSLSTDRVGESDGQTTVTVTGRLNGDAMGSPTTVTVSVGAAGDGATAGTDYATSGGFTFEIPAQATSGSGTFTITPTDDDVDEGNESVTVSGSVTGLTVAPATLTIVDDDIRGLLASPGTVEVPEGDMATYTLVLESKPTATVTVTATRTGDADITVTGGSSLTFTADDWYLPQTVTLSAADDADDQDGTATITHATSGGDYGANSVSASVTAVEQDKMDAAAKVTLSVGPDDVGESDGQTTVTVTGRLDGEALASPTTVTVRVGASGDGATAGTDYATSGGFTFEIAAQATSGSGTFTITPTDDDVDEGNESVTVSGSVTGLTVAPATLTIVDDDIRGLLASPGTVEVPEGDMATYTLVLESKPTAKVTVMATRTGDADITVTGGGSLSFTADDWYLPQTVTLSAAQDEDDENGTATIAHTTSGGDYGANDVTTSVTAIEKDDEGASDRVMLSLDPEEVGEGNGQTTVTVTGRLDRAALTSTTRVTVSVGAGGDGAAPGTDYGAVTGFTFEIAAGATSGSGTFSITPTDDNADEGDETVTVSGTARGLTVDGATLVIVDDDARGLLASRSTVEVPEGETATYTLVLESEPTATVTVTATRTGDADITVTGGGSLSFTADDWYLPQTVTLSAAQDEDDENGTATIAHTTSGGDYGANDVTTSVTAIEIDDEGAWKLTFRSGGSEVTSVSEGTDGSVEVVVSRGGAFSTAKEITLSGDGSAVDGADWQLETTTITLAAGTTEATGTMSILDDRQLEDPESVTVRAHVDGSEAASGSLEIFDEDRAVVSLVTETPTVVEGSSVTVSVIVEPTDAGCIVPFDIMPSISFEDSDGTVSSSVPTVVMIPACESAATFSFDTDDDDEVTSDRLVVFTAAVSEDDRISGGTLTVRVTDNDNSPAEGAPTISGIPRVDETLTAHTDGISDADGLTSVAYRYQWLRVSGGSETEIPDATEQTYLVQEADVGSRLKVRVDFADDAGNAESLTSAPTDEVTAAPVTPVVTIEPDMTTVIEGEAALFTISAVPAPERDLTINVRVSGTNDVVAGVPVSTATIGVGQDIATLTVQTDNDEVDEGDVAGTVTTEVLAGAEYEVGTPASGAVTILDDDEAPITDLSGWLARVGRTASDQVVETVRDRMTRGPGGNRVVIGGWDVEGLQSHYSIRPSDRLAMWSVGDQSNAGKIVRDLFGRSSFTQSGQMGGDGGYWSVWGRGARTRFSGGEGAASVDGEMNGFMAGFDFGRGRWVGGVVVSHNRADGTLGSGIRERDVGTNLTGAYPWARYALSDQFSVWGMLGYAGGSLSLDAGSDSDPSASLAMAAFGWRGDVVGTSGEEGFSLAVTSDAMVSRASTPGDAAIGEQDGAASRARLLVEGSHNFQIGDATLEPLAEVGVRRDVGDAETGAGMEMGGGLRVTVPSLGLTLQGRARGLVAHEDGTYEEWGGSAVLRVQPNASGEGLSLRVAPAWGYAEGGAARLFDRRDMSGIASGRGPGMYQTGQMEAEVGYGVPLLYGLVAMPFGGLMGEARRVGLGLRAASLFDIRFEGLDGYGRRAMRLVAGLETGGFTLSLEGSHGARGSEASLSLWSRFREE
ncbi:Calx-beta domain-containing protein [Candidatus Palauibacter sp.]|uniref:Calx-beta domain-containing protein n=1 Tax=Candidatus Palauibacter sp. TaxID=3101350 RepID=UPI003B59E297